MKDIKNIADEIKHYLDEGVKILDKYYIISQDIIEKYLLFNTNLKNFQVVETLNLLSKSNKDVLKDLNLITNTNNDWEEKFKIIYHIYINDRDYYINKKENCNEIESGKILKTDKINIDNYGNKKLETKKKPDKKFKNYEKIDKEKNKKKKK